jgi:hypothetical protein
LTAGRRKGTEKMARLRGTGSPIFLDDPIRGIMISQQYLIK